MCIREHTTNVVCSRTHCFKLSLLEIILCLYMCLRRIVLWITNQQLFLTKCDVNFLMAGVLQNLENVRKRYL